jgi:hypothetical protein
MSLKVAICTRGGVHVLEGGEYVHVVACMSLKMAICTCGCVIVLEGCDLSMWWRVCP